MCLGASLRIKEILAGLQLVVFSRRRQVRKKKIRRMHEKTHPKFNRKHAGLPFYLFDDDRLCKCNTGDCGKKRRFEVELERQQRETKKEAIGDLAKETLFY